MIRAEHEKIPDVLGTEIYFEEVITRTTCIVG
jgi:hypothetical protein